MNPSDAIRQDPPPGARLVRFRGDTLRFTLALAAAVPGTAWIRTNIGHAAVARRAIIAAVDKNTPPLGTDWFDIPLRPVDSRRFAVALPLAETGHFEAKGYFLPAGEKAPLWPAGANTSINVGPAGAASANIIYNAFVRQFGPNRDGRQTQNDTETACIRMLDQKGCTVIPRSGTFRDLIAQLDFILGRLGCRFVHLLPVSPTPTTYGRMGRFGSPYAALHFTGIDPALAVFDFKATPLEQFIELVDAVHARRAGLILDIAVNSTGWAAGLHETHPRWLVRDVAGEIRSPGAWGVVWRDLASLDYTCRDLWRYIASVFLTWCRRGVDGFRCDAGYMIPLPAWTYIIARVREEFPDAVFLLEGLGGSIAVTRDLLNRANFNWAYSELFQNDDREQISRYLPETFDISEQDGLAVHYAETHDNNRLAARSQTYAAMRTALCALCSCRGGFGFANGVEWFADAKIDVHEARPLNWGSPVNQVDAIRRLNILLRFHPAFAGEAHVRLVTRGEGNCLALARVCRPSGKTLIVVVNLDDLHPVRAAWERQAGGHPEPDIDLLSGKEMPVDFMASVSSCPLSPGQVLCLTADKKDLAIFDQPADLSFDPDCLLTQKKRAKVLDVLNHWRGIGDVSDIDMTRAADRLVQDPVAFCRSCNPESDEHRIVFWRWPQDLRRQVTVPAGHFLLVRAADPLRGALLDGEEENERVTACEESLPAQNKGHFILFAPSAVPSAPARRTLRLSVYGKEGVRHEAAPLLFLGDPKRRALPARYRRRDLLRTGHLFLTANGRGGMCRADVRWGVLNSRYDALLAANLNPDCPDDRRVMFTRCRAWIVYQAYSQEVCLDSLDFFRREDGAGIWNFRIPTGQGGSIDLRITVRMIAGENAVRLAFERLGASPGRGMLDDAEPVQLILRPDIEDRSFHDTTKAYSGPEAAWPAATHPGQASFVFAPAPERKLTVRISEGRFVREPQWQYMVHRSADAERGQDPASDLWSPGYFTSFLSGGETVFLSACANDASTETAASVPRTGEKLRPTLEESLSDSLCAFLVKRGSLLSVIAGYPWFLDWGRDSLIFARGLIGIGLHREAKAILRLFGGLEDRGTLPNMISGKRTENRTTVDASLWFLAALADLTASEKSNAFLDTISGGRSLRDIALSIGRFYIAGTPGGVRMDPASNLIYSPACFTWMDTNHPACTPRQGYCIEIQALWHKALVFLSGLDPEGRAGWAGLASGVAQSLAKLFALETGYLADCLTAAPGEPAACARPDAALRPNQLLALTLDAVTDRPTGKAVLDACQLLLVPGAIRSLTDEPDGAPSGAYRGRYIGDEDTSRKPAYHNGTAWTWLFPAYCEAYAKVYGEKGKAAARSWLAGSLELLRDGCVGHIPEILDGDYPHTQQGCDAQAWGLSEWLRVWTLLKADGSRNFRAGAAGKED